MRNKNSDRYDPSKVDKVKKAKIYKGGIFCTKQLAQSLALFAKYCASCLVQKNPAENPPELIKLLMIHCGYDDPAVSYILLDFEFYLISRSVDPGYRTRYIAFFKEFHSQ